jgi:16S rRNA (uracil1498-N3)-methyltransferase
MEAEVELIELTARGASGRVVERRIPAREPSLNVTVMVALTRQEKWEWILQKGTELGVAHFVPIETARCVARLDMRDWPRKRERWARILVEATEQSGRTHIPTLGAPRQLKTLPRSEPAGIVLHTSPNLQSLRSILASVQVPTGNSLSLLFGPEGGLDPAEVDMLAEAGWTLAGLGPGVLRCETAVIAACVLALIP